MHIKQKESMCSKEILTPSNSDGYLSDPEENIVDSFEKDLPRELIQESKE